ncbi:DUF883 family protein [Oceaniglobus ichthyenteri]|uniref:DUF883 family protein n=1 Tax=Oceaniglobus ichthyenteri TaxID=2136177 RepID=UPI00197E0744|nr:DUF883 family protein [Oceaniglobus ichthyenteri]
MANAKTPTTEDLSKQVDELKEDILKLTQTITDLSKAKGQELTGTVRQRADAARAAGEAQIAEFQSQAVAGFENAEDYVRRNPGTALGIAAGVGVLVGLMTARR